MENLHLPLECEKYYHIYNRGIDGTSIFKEAQNYTFFLQKYGLYLVDVVDTFAYCLLGNHFHFLIRVKDETSLTNFVKVRNFDKVKSTGLHSPEHLISKQFARLFSSYTQSFNKVYQRTGSLFETPFKRKLIDNDSYFTKVITYIHQNPQNHGLVADFKEYPYSSYHSLLSQSNTKLKREEVLAWFGDADWYQKSHLTTKEDDLRWKIEF
jgi:putative transposase